MAGQEDLKGHICPDIESVEGETQQQQASSTSVEFLNGP